MLVLIAVTSDHASLESAKEVVETMSCLCVFDSFIINKCRSLDVHILAALIPLMVSYIGSP